MQDFHKLKAWEKGHQVTLTVYRVTKSFPKEELFGLTSQIRRASASIPANIAEGCCRTQTEFAHFLQIAIGSASELEYHLLLAKELGYLTIQQYSPLNEEVVQVKRMISTLIQRLKHPHSLTDN